MGRVRAEAVEDRVTLGAGPDVGRDLLAPGLLVAVPAVEPVGEPAVDAIEEHDDGRELGLLLEEGLPVLLDQALVDVGAGLGAAVEAQRLAHRPISRARRRSSPAMPYLAR